MSSLYQRIGGEAAVNAAVDLFYIKVLADQRINHFFTNTDMAQQRQHQKIFLTYAFGGLPSYPGQEMRAAHAHLVEKFGLNDHHFNAVIENIGAALKELNVPGALIAEAAAIAESVRNDVLNK
jgi:hemoglobin